MMARTSPRGGRMPQAVGLRARRPEQVDGLLVATDLEADLLEYAVGMRLDRRERLFASIS